MSRISMICITTSIVSHKGATMRDKIGPMTREVPANRGQRGLLSSSVFFPVLEDQGKLYLQRISSVPRKDLICTRHAQSNVCSDLPFRIAVGVGVCA